MLPGLTRRAPVARRRLLVLGLLCLPLGASSGGARAADFPVSNADQLKAAIEAANINGQADTITLVKGTYTLTAPYNNGPNGLPAIVDEVAGTDVILNGNDAVIQRGGATGTPPQFRIFFIAAGAGVTLSNLTIAGGDTAFDGGGIYNAGTLTVNNSTLSGNRADRGGGIYNAGGQGGTLTVNNSTFSGNSALLGGGLRNVGFGGATVINSTFSGNNAVLTGGAINNDDGPLTLRSNTFSGNSAPVGGGISNYAGRLVLSNTLLQTGTAGENIYSENGTVVSQGYNLSSDNGGGFLTAPGDRTSTPTLLDPNGLQNNGGPTQTIALLPGSPAIDQGRDIGGTRRDQRGLVRPVDLSNVPNNALGDGSDIGAFEVQNEIAGDTTPPVITSVSVSPNNLHPANNKLVDVTVSYSVTDANDPSPDCELSVTSNDPGTTRDDIIIVDAHTVRLRASKAKGGKSPDRVYTITITCTDASGNTARATATVTVSKKDK